MAKRNYFAEAKELNISYNKIAKDIGLNARLVAQIAKGEKELPKGLYETARNVSRRAHYSSARKAGIPASRIPGKRPLNVEDYDEESYNKSPDLRRQIVPELNKEINRVVTIIDHLQDKWNRGFEFYKRDPQAWKDRTKTVGKNGRIYYRKPPHKISRNEIKLRIEKGLKFKSVEEIENY